MTWISGQDLAIASSDYDADLAEVHKVGSRLGFDVSLQTALGHDHYAGEQYFHASGAGGDAWKVEERAEVGLLARKVKITGVESSASPGEFGHVFFYRDPLLDPPLIDLNWAEFRDLGIDGALMRYPVHFHQIGDPGPGATLQVRNCSVRDSVLHGIVVHGTQGVTVENNVIFNVAGYGIYLEENDPLMPTVGNSILGNLVLVNALPATPPESPVGEHDPANFAIRNPRNTITGNVAAGSQGAGFYFKLAREATPVSYAGMVFSDNEAHSCGTIGIFQDGEIRPIETLMLPDCFVWKVRRNGLWFRCVGELIVENLIAADCRNGFYPATIGLRNSGEGHHTVRDCLFVGETDNLGAAVEPWEIHVGHSLPQIHSYERENHPLPWSVLSGVEIYDGFVEIEDCRFARFTDLDLGQPPLTPLRRAAGVTQVAKRSTWSNDPRNVVRGLDFGTNVDRRAYLRDYEAVSGDNQIAFTFIADEDDSLGYGSGVLLFPNVDFLGANQPLATAYGDVPFTAPGLNGYVVFAVNAEPSSAGLSFGQLTLKPHYAGGTPPADMDSMSFTQVFDPSGTPTDGEPWVCVTVPVDPLLGGSGEYSFPVSLETGDDAVAAEVRYYRIAYPAGHTTPVAKNLDLWLRFTPRVGDVVFVEIPYAGGTGPGGKPSSVQYVNSQSDLVTIIEFSPSTSTPLQEFLTSPTEQAFWYVPSNLTLFLKLTSIVKQGYSPYPEGTQIEFRIRK